MVFGKYDPALLSDTGEPDFVFCILGEVIVMDMDGCPRLTERCGNALFSEGPIEEKDRNFRRLRPGART